MSRAVTAEDQALIGRALTSEGGISESATPAFISNGRAAR